jgi:hypothetical protein
MQAHESRLLAQFFSIRRSFFCYFCGTLSRPRMHWNGRFQGGWTSPVSSGRVVGVNYRIE